MQHRFRSGIIYCQSMVLCNAHNVIQNLFQLRTTSVYWILCVFDAEITAFRLERQIKKKAAAKKKRAKIRYGYEITAINICFQDIYLKNQSKTWQTHRAYRINYSCFPKRVTFFVTCDKRLLSFSLQPERFTSMQICACITNKQNI